MLLVTGISLPLGEEGMPLPAEVSRSSKLLSQQENGSEDVTRRWLFTWKTLMIINASFAVSDHKTSSPV